MKSGDLYRHYKKGHIYEFICIALSKDVIDMDLFNPFNILNNSKIEIARYHEDTYDLLYCKHEGDIFIIDSDLPHVIYKNENGLYFAREVDDYFGYTQNSFGEWEKRFRLISNNNFH